MKQWAVLLLAVLAVGCATKGTGQPAIPYTQLEQFKVSNADCPRTDQIIAALNQSLAQYRILDQNPEDLTEPQRKYNEKAKIVKWSLIIGCNNPDRYSN